MKEIKDVDLRCLEDFEQDAKREMWARNHVKRRKQNHKCKELGPYSSSQPEQDPFLLLNSRIHSVC